MKNVRRLMMVGTVLTLVGAASVTAFAASGYNTPAEAVAGLTGKSLEEVTIERYENGKTYCTIAKDAGKLEEFQAEMLEVKKDMLADRVAAGLMTQERADEILAAIEKNQAVCDGTGTLRAGQSTGAGFGGMMGNGRGNGQGNGLDNGQGSGRGNGQGMGGGQCGGLCLTQ